MLFVVLIARQVVIYLTYGLYPLLIVFWVADAGPLKYGKQLSAKLFKATGMLVPVGILIAGIFAVGTKFTENTTSQFAGGALATATGADATFASMHPIIQLILPFMSVAATCMMPIVFLQMTLSGMMGGAASKMAGKAKGVARSGMSSVAGAFGAGGDGGLIGGASERIRPDSPPGTVAIGAAGDGEAHSDDSDDSFMQENVDDPDNPDVRNMDTGRETDTDTGPSPVSSAEYAETDTRLSY